MKSCKVYSMENLIGGHSMIYHTHKSNGKKVETASKVAGQARTINTKDQMRLHPSRVD